MSEAAPITYPNTDRDRWPAEDIAFCRNGVGGFEPVEEVAWRSYSGPLLIGGGTVFCFNVPGMLVEGRRFAEALAKEFRKESILAQIMADGKAAP